MRSPQARVEQDFLGEKVIQAGTYWGVHTARAVENFTASGTPVSVHPARRWRASARSRWPPSARTLSWG